MLLPTLVTGVLGLGAVLYGWLHYLWLIPQERVPARATAHRAVIGIGMALSVIALALAARSGGVAAAAALAVLSLPTGALFFYLLSIAPLPDGELVVGEGDALPDFAAQTDTGAPWSSAELRSGRVLLKFFRGHW